MPIDDIKEPTSPDKAGDDARPFSNVGKPNEGSVRTEDDVKGLRKHFSYSVHVRFDEASGDPQLCGEPLRGPDRFAREVDAGHDRAFSCPPQRVEAEVALQMEHRLASHVADFGKLHGQEG